jgi:hypothetical protein
MLRSVFAIVAAIGWSSSWGADAEMTSPHPKLPSFTVIKTIPLPDSLPDNFFDYASVDSAVGKLFIGTEDPLSALAEVPRLTALAATTRAQ